MHFDCMQFSGQGVTNVMALVNYSIHFMNRIGGAGEGLDKDEANA